MGADVQPKDRDARPKVHEVKRGLIRIGSNYARLLISLILSLAFVPLLLIQVGNDGLSLILLFGSTVGIAAMFQEINQRSMVRELGAAYHAARTGSDDVFRATYHSALSVSMGIALLAAAVFALLYSLVPYFKVDGLESAARGMIVARGIASVLKIVLAPPFNMLLVTERMIAFNFWQLIIQRAHGFMAAVALFFIPFDTAAEGVIIFAWISSAIIIAATLIATTIEIMRDRRLIPSIRLTNRKDVKDIVHTTGWNSAVIAAMNLYTRVDAIIMNIVFGLMGNLAFGLAVLLTSYARRVTVGMTDGLDAVSARVHAGETTDGMRNLMQHSTRLHAIVAFPAAFLIAILADPLLRLWIGKRLEDPETAIVPTTLMIQVLMIGIAVRGVSDGWARILYGIGQVRAYAPLIVVGGVLNPILAVALIWVLPSGSMIEFLAVCIATSLILTVSHGLLLPRIAARLTGMTYVQAMQPLLRPLVVSAIAAVIPLVAMFLIDDWTLWWLAGVVLSFMGVYAALTLTVTMDSNDRKMVRRIGHRVRQRLTGRAAVATQELR